MHESHENADTEQRGNNAVPRIKVWLTAGRVWALPASTMSVAFGTLLAVTVGGAAFDFVPASGRGEHAQRCL
jgi:hypothetical protein